MRAHDHVERFNEAVESGDWKSFADTFTEDALMVFTNVPVGPYSGRSEILRGYEERPPDDTMSITTVEAVDDSTDRVRFAWDSGGPGTMLLRWRDDQVELLEITFG